MARGSADGAAIHLRHVGGTYNAPFATALLRHRRPHLLRLWRREQGIIVAPGNPHAIRTVGDLADLRLAKRGTGAGTRVLLDQALVAAGLAPNEVHGPELHSHLEVALAVAAGIADAGIGLHTVAIDLDLDFIPLTWEQFDIALGADALGAARPLITALRTKTVLAAIADLGGYDTTPAGTVEPLSEIE